LPHEAPFDAILVSAGGPKVPEALKRQLAIGGRMVIPVGSGRHQTLFLVRRSGEDMFEEQDHGAVAFVPLIGVEGWVEPEAEETAIDAQSSGFAAGLLAPAQRAKAIRSRLGNLIAETAEPFGNLDELARLAERFAHKRVVLLGEATHGTAEFYDARAAITAMLVKQHGFNIVAVEADWPDAAVYDAYVRGLPRPKVPAAPSRAFLPGCGGTVRSAPFSTVSRRSTKTSARPSANAASMASTSTASAPRSPPCCFISTPSIPKPPESRASAMAALRLGVRTPRATGAWRSPAATRSARNRSQTRCSIFSKRLTISSGR
jgi:hypothetical protein